MAENPLEKLVIQEKLPSGHEDDRRVIYDLFNGSAANTPFSAVDVKVYTPDPAYSGECHAIVKEPGRALYAPIGPEPITFGIYAANNRESLSFTRDVKKGEFLLVQGNTILSPILEHEGQILVACYELQRQQRLSVPELESRSRPGHKDDPQGVANAMQVSTKEMKLTRVLANHYHHYAEEFLLVSGVALFRKKHIREPTLTRELLFPGHRTYVPAETAHDVLLKKGSVLLHLCEKPYINAENNDIKYTIEPSIEEDATLLRTLFS